jgi:hypothetical protein
VGKELLDASFAREEKCKESRERERKERKRAYY